MSAPASIVVPILGMHRSGTSMLTHALHCMGLALGEPLMAASDDNPHGYWENEFFVQVDEQLLAALGQAPGGFDSTERLLAIPDLAGRAALPPAVLEQIRTHLHRSFGPHPRWGWKDPRTVLLLPLWLRLLPQLGFPHIRPVVIARPAAQCIASLQRRATATGGPPIRETALHGVWQAYNRILLHLAQPAGWTVTTHALLTHPDTARDELTRISQALGLDDTRVDAALATIRTREARDGPPPTGPYAALAQLAEVQRHHWQQAAPHARPSVP